MATVSRQAKLAVKYLPLDLSAYANVGPEPGRGGDGWRWTPGGPLVRSYGPHDPPSLAGFPFGKHRFWGIPFNLSDPANNQGRCWTVISGDEKHGLPGGITINLPEPVAAGCLIFAHFTDVEGPAAQVGELLAIYTAVLADHRRVSWPIRRGFEINARRPSIGSRGYATVDHIELRPVRVASADREGITGQLTDEGSQRYWLWSAELPAPGEPIVAIELLAQANDLLAVGGITAARDHTNPLRRSPRTGVYIQLPSPDRKSSGTPTVSDSDESSSGELVVVGDVSIAVDAGQVVRATPASDMTPAAWCAAPMRGWGEQPSVAPPAGVYAEIHAADSADIAVRRGDSRWTVPWRDVLQGTGRSADGQVRIQVAHPQLARVAVQVVDADTGQAIPARVHLRRVRWRIYTSARTFAGGQCQLVSGHRR